MTPRFSFGTPPASVPGSDLEEHAIEEDRGSPAFERLRDRTEGRGNGGTPEMVLRRGVAPTWMDDGDHVVADSER